MTVDVDPAGLVTAGDVDGAVVAVAAELVDDAVGPDVGSRVVAVDVGEGGVVVLVETTGACVAVTAVVVRPPPAVVACVELPRGIVVVVSRVVVGPGSVVGRQRMSASTGTMYTSDCAIMMISICTSRSNWDSGVDPLGAVMLGNGPGKLPLGKLPLFGKVPLGKVPFGPPGNVPLGGGKSNDPLPLGMLIEPEGKLKLPMLPSMGPPPGGPPWVSLNTTAAISSTVIVPMLKISRVERYIWASKPVGAK